MVETPEYMYNTPGLLHQEVLPYLFLTSNL